MRSPLAFLAAAGLAGLVATAAGCPIYSDNNDRRVCDGRSCELCPGDNDFYDDWCHTYYCRNDLDCPAGYTCGLGDEQCHGSGYDNYGDGGAYTVDASDCASAGCAPGYQCLLAAGVTSCVPMADAAGADASAVDGAPSLFDSGPVSCRRDLDCTASGARCLDGTCVAPADQCTDGTQCSSGGQCVQGACTPACDASTACPTGFTCDTTKAVCTGNTTPCGEEPGAVACSAALVCAQDHCVTPCNSAGVCGDGLVCVEGGCVPNERAAFTCTTEGVQDVCAAGSVCLHHSCYIACQIDAGANGCKSADAFNVCKAVVTASGTYDVCGSNTSLGTDCDPTQGKACASPLLCIDGFCR